MRIETRQPEAGGCSRRIPSCGATLSRDPAPSITASQGTGEMMISIFTMLPALSKRYSITFLTPFSSGPMTTRGGRPSSLTPLFSLKLSRRMLCFCVAAAVFAAADDMIPSVASCLCYGLGCWFGASSVFKVKICCFRIG